MRYRPTLVPSMTARYHVEISATMKLDSLVQPHGAEDEEKEPRNPAKFNADHLFVREIHGLAWADIVLDGESSMLTVRRNYRGKPKNEASAATVPISSDAAALLHHWRAEQGEPSLWVFPGVHGQIIAHSSYPEACKIHRTAERAGIHTHVSFGCSLHVLCARPFHNIVMLRFWALIRLRLL